MVSAMNSWPPGTGTGTELDDDASRVPQQYGASVVVIPQATKLPAVTVENESPPVTATGTVLELLDPSPSGPVPQQYAGPLAVRLQVLRPPALTDRKEEVVLTVMAARSLTPSLVAITAADPMATPVTRPFGSGVATAALSLVQVIGCPVSALPFASRIVADSCSVPPTARVADLGVTVTEATPEPGPPGSPEQAPSHAAATTTARAIAWARRWRGVVMALRLARDLHRHRTARQRRVATQFRTRCRSDAELAF